MLCAEDYIQQQQNFNKRGHAKIGHDVQDIPGPESLKLEREKNIKTLFL